MPHLLPILLLLAAPLAAQQSAPPLTFDAEMATRLGADVYGMTTYYAALLQTGPQRDQDEATAMEIQKGHMAHIRAMSESGKLVLAGPFLDGAEFRGIFILDVASAEEARALCAADPAVQSGRLQALIIPWYGTAALREVPDIHRRIQEK
jgi:uncharacterized protein